MKSIIQYEFSEHLKTSQAAMNSLCGPIEVAAKICINSLKSGGKILLFGNGGGEMNTLCSVNIVVPSDDTPRIQEIHILIGHTICQIIDQK